MIRRTFLKSDTYDANYLFVFDNKDAMNETSNIIMRDFCFDSSEELVENPILPKGPLS